MKTAVLYGKEDIRIEEREKPVVGPGQMLVQISYVGICGTDREFYKLGGAPTPLPKVLGHENCGVVCEIGEGVEGFEIGDRVLCGPPTHCAEDCTPCSEGKTNICIHGFPNTAGIGMPDGGYAEYFLVKDVAHTMIVKVPENIKMEDAVLFDVICVALHGIRVSDYKLGDAVVVSGMGPIGLSTVQFLKAAGAHPIIALNRSEAKKDAALAYGADYFLSTAKTENIGEEIRKILGSDVGADVVFECSGQPSSVELCAKEAVRPGGQVMLIGTVQEPLTFALGDIQIAEIDMKSSFVYLPKEVEMYLSMLAAGKISFPDMVTDIVPLEECKAQGFDRDDMASQRKILIKP
jgi:(R,R)-butanediol dehydrogenase/meso-butanediol dehydrogenase/diacetyl reductase